MINMLVIVATLALTTAFSFFSVTRLAAADCDMDCPDSVAGEKKRFVVFGPEADTTFGPFETEEQARETVREFGGDWQVVAILVP